MKWDCISLELWAKIKYGPGQIIIKSNLYKLGFVVSPKIAPKNISSRLWKYLMFVKVSDHVRWNVNSTFSDKLMAPRCSFSFAQEKTFQSRLTYWMLCVKYASTWVLLSNFYALCTLKGCNLFHLIQVPISYANSFDIFWPIIGTFATIWWQSHIMRHIFGTPCVVGSDKRPLRESIAFKALVGGPMLRLW